MNIKNITKVNVLQTNFTIGFPCHFRLEMKVQVEEANGDVYEVPMLIVDESWVFDDENNMSYKQDKKMQTEMEKYTILEGTYNRVQDEIRSFTEDEKEVLKKRIFDLCEEEITAQRAVVEENMVRFCSHEFDQLPESEQERIMVHFS